MGMQWQSVMAQKAQNKALGIINFKEERYPSKCTSSLRQRLILNNLTI